MHYSQSKPTSLLKNKYLNNLNDAVKIFIASFSTVLKLIHMKLLLVRQTAFLVLFLASTVAIAQQSANTVDYKVTYNFSDQKYTVWVVPGYPVPNNTNSGQDELGATAQVTLAVPKDFVIRNVTDVTGSWEKSPLKLGPGQPNQDWSTSSLNSDTNYYALGKSADETNYGSFQSGIDVALFTFESNDCFGSVRIINPDEPIIVAAKNKFSLNVANSFYSRSGQSSGGNQSPLEQFRSVAGTAAICTLDFIANPDNRTTPPGIEVTIPVLDNDTKDGSPLIPSDYTVSIDTNPVNGTVSVNNDGTVNYTPNAGFSGIDCFVYRVCEVDDPSVCRTADVCVTVPVARQIFAFDDNNIADINTPVSGSVTTNDFFNNGIPPFVVSTTPFSLPTNGSVTLSSNGRYTYTPNNGFTGTDIFEYRVCDSGNPTACDIAAVSIDVQSNNVVNKPPIALGDKVVTKTNVAVRYNVLLNDLEPDGQPLSATLLIQPVNGSLIFNPDGTFTYTPTTDFEGQDSFTYQACDNAIPELCDDALVQIEVYDFDVLDQPPVANDDIYIRQTDQNVTGNVLPNDIDPNGLILTVNTTPLSPPSKGTIVLNGNGSFEYTPGVNFEGFDSFVYEVCNNSLTNRCSQATVFILAGRLDQESTDISVVKLVNQSTVELNDEIIFSIIVKNNGSVVATNVVVKDSLPTGLQYLSGAESIRNGQYFWEIGLLLPGESKTLTINTKVIMRGVSTNTASIDTLDQIDTNPTNDVSAVCISVPIVLCQGESLELSVPGSSTNVQWYKDDVFFASGNTLLVTESGSYTNKSAENTCPTNNCCPIVVVTQLCCPAEICIPITIKKVR
jgi:uncharacterized repeat protein (TIGR01451 family)